MPLLDYGRSVSLKGLTGNKMIYYRGIGCELAENCFDCPRFREGKDCNWQPQGKSGARYILPYDAALLIKDVGD